MNPHDETVDDAPIAVTLDAPGAGAEASITVTREQPGRYVPPGADPTVNELGRGGIGRVLVVRDAHLSREVALKELLTRAEPGSAASGRDSVVLTRFLREARITGQLEHPNIVPVYELGQRPDGTLYYTMKVVRGRTLTEALADCDGLSDRLALLKHFADLCNAMAYAHARGVIHRDLKPGNVMLGEFGETVLLDWGLARPVDGAAAEALDRPLPDAAPGPDDPAATTEGSVLGTPLYMSPEQARGEADLDARSDVWSLGVMLYELVTGQRPFTGRSVLTVLTAVTTGRPEPVLSVEPGAPPELAAVIMRALARDKAERYADASALAADVGAFLIGDRVRAYRYGLRDVLARFARRHVVSLSVSAVAAALLIGLGVWAYIEVRGERDRAVDAETRAMAAAEQARSAESSAMKARDQAEGLVQYMVGDLRQTLEPLGRLDLLDRVVDRVSAHAEVASGGGADPARVRSQAGTRYLIARLAAARGRTDEARAAATEAHRLRAGLATADPSPDNLLALARSELQLAGLDQQRGDRASAERHVEAASARLAPLAEGGDPEARHSRSEALTALGDLRGSGGDLEAAEALYRQALSARSAMVRADPDETRWKRALAETHDRLGDARFDQGDPEGALLAFGEARTIREALVAARPNNLQWVRALGVSHDQLGDVYFHKGQNRKALAAWQEAMDRLTRAYTANPSHLGWRRDAAIGRLKMTDGLAALGQTEAAARALEGVIRDLEDLATQSREDTGRARDLNVARWRRADLLVGLGRLGEAEGLIDAALADAAALVKRVPEDATFRHDHAVAHLERGDLSNRQGDAVAAAVAYRTAARELGRLAENDRSNAIVEGDRAVAHQRLKRMLERPDLDRAALWRAVEAADTRETPMPPTAVALAGFGRGGGGGGRDGGGGAPGGAAPPADGWLGASGAAEKGRQPDDAYGGERAAEDKADDVVEEAEMAAKEGGPPAAPQAMPAEPADDAIRGRPERKAKATASAASPPPPPPAPPRPKPTRFEPAKVQAEPTAEAARAPVAAADGAQATGSRDPLSLLDDPLLMGVDPEAAPTEVRPWVGAGDRAAPRNPMPSDSPDTAAEETPAKAPRRDPARRPIDAERGRMRPPAVAKPPAPDDLE